MAFYHWKMQLNKNGRVFQVIQRLIWRPTWEIIEQSLVKSNETGSRVYEQDFQNGNRKKRRKKKNKSKTKTVVVHKLVKAANCQNKTVTTLNCWSFFILTKANRWSKLWLSLQTRKYGYSGISIRRTHHKVDISIRRTVNLGTERFPGQTLIRKSL